MQFCSFRQQLVASTFVESTFLYEIQNFSVFRLSTLAYIATLDYPTRHAIYYHLRYKSSDQAPPYEKLKLINTPYLKVDQRLWNSPTRLLYFDELVSLIMSFPRDDLLTTKVEILKNDFDTFTIKRTKGDLQGFRELKAFYVEYIKTYGRNSEFFRYIIRYALKYNDHSFFNFM